MKHSAFHIAQTRKQHTTNELYTAWEDEAGDAAVAEWIGMPTTNVSQRTLSIMDRKDGFEICFSVS
jgi:hypothetical protein